MTNNASLSLTVKHKQINIMLSFSDIQSLPTGNQALTCFVSEMSSALHAIHCLRNSISSAKRPHEARSAEALFRTVIQTTSDYYVKAYTYACRSAKVAQPATDPESKTLLDFELNAAPFIRELSDSMSVLRGYVTFPIQVDQPTAESIWDPRDWCIERLIKLIKAHEEHISSKQKGINRHLAHGAPVRSP